MASREAIECRIYMAEDAMYRRSGELDRHLHDLESRLEDLTASVHRVLCETGQLPLEAKTGTIVQAIEAFETGIDLGEIRALAERVTSLKGLIDDFEREIVEGGWMSGATSEDPSLREVLARHAEDAKSPRGDHWGSPWIPTPAGGRERPCVLALTLVPRHGSVSEAATEYGRKKGISVIDGGWPCMFAPTADLGHKAMRFVFTLKGNVPRRV